jgi:hypothetical protein
MGCKRNSRDYAAQIFRNEGEEADWWTVRLGWPVAYRPELCRSDSHHWPPSWPRATGRGGTDAVMILDHGMKLGPYEILEPLGAGRMGAVYRARKIRLVHVFDELRRRVQPKVGKWTLAAD